jgi:hypothetical protein
MNGRVTGSKGMCSNWVRRLCPSVSAVMAVLSDTKKTER